MSIEEASRYRLARPKGPRKKHIYMSRILAAQYRTWEPLPTKPELKTVTQIEQFAHSILSKKWIIKWFPHAPTIQHNLRILPRGPWRLPHYYYRHGHHNIFIPRRHRHPYWVVHLLLLALIPQDTPHYTREFARQMTRIYRIVFGVQKSKQLKQNFKKYGCKYSKHHYPHGIPDTTLTQLKKNLGHHITCHTKTGPPNPAHHSTSQVSNTNSPATPNSDTTKQQNTSQ